MKKFIISDARPPANAPDESLKNQLNPQQYEAVNTFEGSLLCIAGAGSGKTRTLVYRLAKMIQSGIKPESILLLTFTRKAAQNMLEKARSLTGLDAKRVSGGTYHGFAAKTLRQYGAHANLNPAFSIIDQSDAQDIINLLRAEMGLNKKETRFPLKKTIYKIYSSSINLNISIRETVEYSYPHFSEHIKALTELIEKFNNYKIQNSLLDYEDLLIWMLKLLKNSSDVRNYITNTYRYLMIDEYQDTNRLQAEITLLLSNSNVMVVGDDYQSIYSFRGADMDNILRFPQMVKNCKIIKLQQNYRSTKNILQAANSLMKNADQGYEKTLFTKNDLGEKPAVVKCFDESEQSRFITSRIMQLREEGVELDQIAVLFRSGFHSYQLELELKVANIPFVKWGGFKFLESSHLKDFIAHLRIIHNPIDKISCLRVLTLIDGIGSTTASNISAQITNKNSIQDLEKLNKKRSAQAQIKELSSMLKTDFSDKNPERIIEIVAQYYYPILKNKYDDYPKRMKDIDQLFILSQRHDNLQTMLEEIALEPPSDSVDNNLSTQQEDEKQLILSTIHSAKGLEWHSVFIISVLEGRFPSFTADTNKECLEEERRLMYVAITRAKKNLYICYPSNIYDPSTNSLLYKPSRFIGEIEPEMLENWKIISQ